MTADELNAKLQAAEQNRDLIKGQLAAKDAKIKELQDAAGKAPGASESSRMDALVNSLAEAAK